VEPGDASRGADQAPEPGRKHDNRRLPPELTGLLPKKFEHGLNHVVRRRILRALHERPDCEGNPAGLAGNELVEETVSCVSYHLGVLLRCSMVQLARVEPVRGSVRHTYASVVYGETTVLSVLTQTEELDAPKRQTRGTGEGT
jgi:DNA-binding transcriptional ArsR family regulator